MSPASFSFCPHSLHDPAEYGDGSLVTSEKCLNMIPSFVPKSTKTNSEASDDDAIARGENARSLRMLTRMRWQMVFDCSQGN